MKFGKMMLMSGLLLAAVVCGSVQAADEYSPERPVYDQMTEKLGRGIANVAFGGLEVLIRPYDVNQEQGAIQALTYGVLKGVIFTVARELVGVVDVLTFWTPLPNCPQDPMDGGWGYGPIIRPAWVVDINHNPYNIFSDDQTIVAAQ